MFKHIKGSPSGWVLCVALWLAVATGSHAGSLVLSEIMYHPVGSMVTPVDGDEYEFVELYNAGDASVDLSSAVLTNAISFTFPRGTVLAAGAYLVVAKNPVAYALRYPGALPVLGGYKGYLSNNGEQITLRNAAGTTLFDVTYGDGPDWPRAADGFGASLVLRDAGLDPDRSASWADSDAFLGTPGTAGAVAVHEVVLNEILAHTDPPLEDSVELYNPGTGAVPVLGWFLSDDPLVPRKYEITQAVVNAGSYLVLGQHQFGNSNNPGWFALSELGDTLLLTAPGTGAVPTRLVAFAEFGATANGVSIGLYPNATGQWVTLSARSLGADNGLPRVGPVVISEIMYHPANDNPADEYIELCNTAGTNVSLFDPAYPTNTWTLDGAVTFAFPTGVVLAAQSRLVLCGATNLVDFRRAYQIDSAVSVLGPWAGTLDNAGEAVRLYGPGDPETNGFVPRVLSEEVRYSDAVPWPVAADGRGAALERVDLTAFGNVAANWIAGGPNGSPGRPLAGGLIGPVFTPAHPEPGSVITVDVAVVSGAAPTQVLVRAVSGDVETAVVMRDDGTQGDALAGDRRYTAVLQAPATAGWLNYRFEGISSNGAAFAYPADSVRYSQATGLVVRMSGGAVLTNVSPGESWSECVVDGVAVHTNVFYFYLLAPGEMYLDDVSWVDVAYGREHIPNGSFDQTQAGWWSVGSQAGSGRIVPDDEQGNGVFNLVSTGSGSGSTNAVIVTLDPPIAPGAAFRLRFRMRLVSAWVPQWQWLAVGEPGPDVLINEILYHPGGERGDEWQFVELHNPAPTPRDLGGARLLGVDFSLPPGLTLGSNEYVVCCASQELIRAGYGITNTVGNWAGSLQHDGETLRLVDRFGRELDRARYSDIEPWPVAADGYGPSLERVNGTEAGTTAWAWVSAAAPTNWQTLCWTGPVSAADGPLSFYLDYSGKCWLDDVSLRRVGDGAEQVSNGDFEGNTNGWRLSGNHAWSRVEPGAGVAGGAALALVCNESRWILMDADVTVVTALGDALSNAVCATPVAVSNSADYVFSCRARREGLGENLYAVLGGRTAVVSFAAQGTPGKSNSGADARRALGIAGLEQRYTVCPVNSNNVIRAKLTGAATAGATVRLGYRLVPTNGYEFTDAGYVNVPLRDDGVAPDRLAGDGEFAADVPAVGVGRTLVRYHIEAVATNGMWARCPRPDDPSTDYGYWVEGSVQQTTLPNWYLLVDGNPVTYPVGRRCCAVSPEGQVFTDVLVRHRGRPADPDSVTLTGLALRLHRGRLLNTWFADGQDAINFRHRSNDQWRQKRVVNEYLAYDLQRALGFPAPRLRHVCLWVDGAATLTTELESPGTTFLKAHDIPADDFVLRSGYSGIRPVDESKTGWDNLWSVYDALGRATGPQKQGVIQSNLCVDSVMQCLALLALTANGDQNYTWNTFLQRSAADGRWRQYPWDVDVSFEPQPSGAALAQTNLHPYYRTQLYPSIWGGTSGSLLPQILFFPESGVDSEYTLPFRHRQQTALWRFCHTLFTTNHLYPKLDTLRATLAPAYPQVATDVRFLDRQVAEVKEFIRVRRDFLMNGPWSDRDPAVWDAGRAYDPTGIVINEILAQPVTGGEYIELYNSGPDAVDLGWWRLQVGPESYRLPHGTMIGPTSYLVVADAPADLALTYWARIDRTRLIERYPGYGLWDWPVVWTSATEFASRMVQVDKLTLPNAGGSVLLEDLQGRVIDQLAYSNQLPWPATPGVAMELATPSADNAVATNWRACTVRGTPGFANSTLFDEDGDGLGDAWERRLLAALGGGFTNILQIQPSDDADQDGLDNGTEYVLGSDAAVGNPGDARLGWLVGGRQPSVALPLVEPGGEQYILYSDRIYTIEWTSNLLVAAWQEVTNQTAQAGAGADLSYTNALEPAGFYRAKVRLQRKSQ